MPIRLVDGGCGVCGSSDSIPRRKAVSGSYSSSLRWREVVEGDVSSDAIAVVDCFAVGEFYVRAANLQPGEIPIVTGAGVVGLSAVAALSARRIEPIILSDFMLNDGTRAHGFGAHVLVDPAGSIGLRRLSRSTGRTQDGWLGCGVRMRWRSGADRPARLGGRVHVSDLLRRRLVHRGHTQHHGGNRNG